MVRVQGEEGDVASIGMAWRAQRKARNSKASSEWLIITCPGGPWCAGDAEGGDSGGARVKGLGERPSCGAGWGSGLAGGEGGGLHGQRSLTPRWPQPSAPRFPWPSCWKYLPSLPTTMVQLWRSRRSMDDSTL